MMMSIIRSFVRRPVRRVPALAAGALMLVLAACATGGGGPYTWATDYVAKTPGAADRTYLVAVGDMLTVQVFDNDKMSAKGRVRPDGRLSMPLIGDVPVQGKTPAQVANEVERRLRDQNIILSPRVTVSVDDVLKVRVTVLGAVSRAGNYELEQGSGLAEALAGAGGLTEFAKKDRIFVLRKVPAPVRIRFTFASLTDTGPSGAFKLQQGDVVVVE